MGDSNTRYADIIIDISHEALDRVFQYRVPLSLWKEVRPGSRVFVPFGRGNRETEGYVVAIRPEADYEELDKVIDAAIDRVLASIQDDRRNRENRILASVTLVVAGKGSYKSSFLK